MSANVSTASSIVLSDKFKKELEKFFSWANELYSIKDINDKEKEWSFSLLKTFEEPGRNKLEAYLKEILKNYVISINDTDIEDAKLLAKEFKEKATKKATKKTESESEEKPKKATKKSKKVTEEIESESEEKPKKAKVKATKKEKSEVKLDMSLDTSETYNVDTLDFWTDELESVFGKPKKTGSDEEEHTWEWKLDVNGDVYSIYNWNEYEESYEETTWYLGSTVENKKTVKALNDYIWGFLDKVEQDQEDTEVNEDEKQVEKSPTIEELFGEDSDDDDVEIDLDGIDDM